MEKYKTVRLGDVCEQKQSQMKDIPEKVWLLNLDKVESNTGKILEYEYINRSEIGQSVYQFDESNILYSKLRPYLNKVVLPHQSGFSTSELVPLFPNQSVITREYLVNFLRSDSFVAFISGKVAGAKMPRVVMKDFFDAKIPLPSITEQKKIAAVLEKCTELIEKNKQLLEKYDTLIKSRFIEMFGTPEKNEKGFPLEKIQDVIEFQGGSQPEKKYFEYKKTDSNIRLIQIRDYKTDRFITYIPKEKAKRFCTKDDIMIGRYGPPIFQILQGIEGCYNVALMKAIPKKGNKEFIRNFLKQDCLLHYLESFSTRTAGQDGIQMDKLLHYPFPYPPIELQNEFAAFVQQIDKSKFAVQKSLEKAETLYKSLMQEYFEN